MKRLLTLLALVTLATQPACLSTLIDSDPRIRDFKERSNVDWGTIEKDGVRYGPWKYWMDPKPEPEMETLDITATDK